MDSKNQNGHNQHPTDNNMSASERPICRKFIWGTCNKHSQCKYRHELDIEEMKKTLKFCHDYQNRNGCSREVCRHLHATKEEENLFRTSGQIPHALVERHAAMAMGSNVSLDNIPFVAGPPPPPPIVNLAPPPPPPLPVRATLPVPSTLSGTVQPPPPPPPPAVPSVSSAWPSSQSFGPHINHPVPHVSHNQQPPVLPPGFDASRPPPPLRVQRSGECQNASKHKLPDSNEAGPCKARRADDARPEDEPCENCAHTAERIELYKKEAERIQAEDETQSLGYHKALHELELGKKMLSTMVGTELYRFFEDYMEDRPHFNSASAAIVMELFECLFNPNARNLLGSLSQLTHHVDDTHLLSTLPRRTSSPTPRSTADVINSVMELFRNANIGNNAERSELYQGSNQTSEVNTSNMNVSNNSSVVNGYNGFIAQENNVTTQTAAHNIQMNMSVFYPGPGVPGPSGHALRASSSLSASTVTNSTGSNSLYVNPIPGPSYSDGSRTSYTNNIAAGTSSVPSTVSRTSGQPTVTASAPNTATSTVPMHPAYFNQVMNGPGNYPPYNGHSGYPAFHPGMPPPPGGPFFTPFPNITAGPHMVPPPQPGPPSLRAPPAPAAPPPTTTSAVTAHNFTYTAGRYPPHPPFYPPYQ